MTTAVRWNLIYTLTDGHRLFTSPSRTHIDPEIYGDADYGVAIADASGDTPDQTDDGVLWLDRRRPLIVRTDGGCEIPLRHQGGDTTRTPSNVATILFLAARYNWLVRRAGSDDLYRVTKT